MDREKLIELLKEYNKEKGWHPGLLYEGFGVRRGERNIFEKNFGFIEWLIDNEKIDTDKIDIVGKFTDMGGEVGLTLYSPCQSLRMNLAIQDEPFDFICSLLK